MVSLGPLGSRSFWKMVPAVPPSVQVIASTATVSFLWQSGNPAPAPVIVYLNPPLIFGDALSITGPGSPFTATTSSGASISVGISAGTLAPGTYTSSIVITPIALNGQPTTIPISLTVSASPLVEVSQTTLMFIGPGTDQSNVKVTSTGNPVSFRASASSAGNWLSVSPSSASTPASLTVSADSTTLTEGSYNGPVVVAGPNNTITVPVQLSVGPPEGSQYVPPTVTFSVQTGGAAPPFQTVPLGDGATTVAATTNSGGNWLSASASSTPPWVAVIAVNSAGLKARVYTGTVTTSSSYLPVVATPVTLSIYDTEPQITVTPPSITVTQGLSQILPDYASYYHTVNVQSGGIPLHLDWSTTGIAFLANRPDATPGVATVSLSAYMATGLGSYSGNVAITSGTETVNLPVTLNITIEPDIPPFIGAIVNAASQIQASVAPGEIVSIYGFGAGPPQITGFTSDAAGNVANSLNGAQALFDGKPVPMIYGSPYQANVIVPYEVAGQATTTIQLQYGSVISKGWTVPVVASAPGIFTLGATGIGRAAALNQDNSVNDPANPAARGTVVQIFGATCGGYYYTCARCGLTPCLPLCYP